MARFLGRVSLAKMVRQVSKKRVPLQTYHLNDGLNGTKTHPSFMHIPH